MKMTKKLSALLVALMMALSLTVPALAATVTLPDDAVLAGHSFTAYQVFAGREEDGILSDVVAGSGVNFAAFLTALQSADERFADCVTAADVAKVLGENNTDAALAETVAELAYANKTGDGTALAAGENQLDDGYYLIVDTTENVAAGSAYNKALLQVVGESITIGLKTDAPSVEKKVQENDQYTTDGGYGLGFNDVADYSMGDAVPFRLIGTIPNMAQYDTYLYIFHDSYSAGLDAPQNIKVYLSDDKKVDEADTDVTEAFAFAADENAFSLTCTDLKVVVGESEAKYVIVDYTAVLNESAAVGLDGNINEVTLEYSNNPNHSGVGDTDNTDETPKDVVIVFTYELDTTKIDGATAEDEDPTELAGAEFVLYRGSAEAPEYAVLDENKKVSGWTADKDEATVLVSDEAGLFTVIGLDDGTYWLEEIKAPAGYNLLSRSVEVVISADTANGQAWDSFAPADALLELAVTADGEDGSADKATGAAAITIANNKGATLPETGGMGTTILYVVGGVLVLAAVVLLVTKKRMNDR